MLDHCRVRHRLDGHRLLDQAVEELSPGARGSAIEPKGELVEVVIEMSVAYRPLVGPSNHRFKSATTR